MLSLKICLKNVITYRSWIKSKGLQFNVEKVLTDSGQSRHHHHPLPLPPQPQSSMSMVRETDAFFLIIPLLDFSFRGCCCECYI